MNRMIAGSLAAAALIGAVVALAAPPATSTMPAQATPARSSEEAATCQSLMKQFDMAAPSHNAAPKMVEARARRSTAETACGSGNYKSGISELRAALNDIGVKPVQQ
jgi:hypothetical protein